MTEISDELLCLFSATVEQRDGRYVIEVPKRELDSGVLREGRVYRTSLFSHVTQESTESDEGKPERNQGPPDPPVEKGERREVEIEDIGEQGDGIARVERGYVIIVPDTEKGERVTIEITVVQQNVAFAEVRDRQTHI